MIEWSFRVAEWLGRELIREDLGFFLRAQRQLFGVLASWQIQLLNAARQSRAPGRWALFAGTACYRIVLWRGQSARLRAISVQSKPQAQVTKERDEAKSY